MVKTDKFDSTSIVGKSFLTEDERLILKGIPNTTLVRNHLLRFGYITGKIAKEVYGIERLSDCIYKLRYKIEPLMIIDTEDVHSVNKFGKKVEFGKYIYKGEIVQ